MSRPPRNYTIHDKIPEGFDPGEGALEIISDDEADFHEGRDAGEELSDEDAHAEEQADYFECAVEWLPSLPQIATLIDEGILLDYGILVAARILCEEGIHEFDEPELDSNLAAFLLMAEEDEESRRRLYDLLDGRAQELVLMLDDLVYGPGDDFRNAPHEVRTILFAQAMADIQIGSELLDEDQDVATYDDMDACAQLMQALTEQPGVPYKLIARAVADYNRLADLSELPLSVSIEQGGAIIATRHGNPPPPPTGRPPAP